MRLAEQPDQTGDPDQEQDRVHGDDLLLDERQRPEHHVLSFAAHVFQVLERGEMTVRLPDQVGQKKCDRDGDGDPNPRLGEFAARWSEQQRDRDREAEEERGMFVLEAETGQHAEPYPEPRIARAQNSRDYPNATHPVQRLESIHGQQAVGDQCRRAYQDAEAGEELRITIAAEFASDQDGERDQRGAGQRGQNSQRRQRTAHQQRNLRVDGDQRRGIDITPVEMPGHVEIVELVAKVAVMADAGEQVQQQLGGAERDQNADVKPRERV